MTRDPLHPTTQLIYDTILHEWNTTGRTPTRRGLMRLTGFAHTTITDHLRRLEDAGYIRVQAGVDRGIYLCHEPTPGELKKQVRLLVEELARLGPLAEHRLREMEDAERRSNKVHERIAS